LIQTDVTSVSGYAQGVTPTYAPPTPIARITYAYADDGLLALVTARDANNAILAEDKFEYDDGRHLAREYQAHNGAVSTSTTPKVDYTWEFSPVGEYNFDRLVSMSSPARPEGGNRRT